MRPGHLGLVAVAVVACSRGDRALTPEELLDPTTCATCHPSHVAQWSGSMHAYAAEDPVFRAMNARGQREADLGDFCIQCHAPVALMLGETDDGLDLDAVPQHLRGVTCAWCHTVDAITGDHNAALDVTLDGVMRGGIGDPSPSAPHDSIYSPLHDRNDPESSGLCGSCHDVVTPAGVHLERTYAEWQSSLFAVEGPTRQSCGHCHMTALDVPVTQGSTNTMHDHTMPGVDVPLTDFPLRDSHVSAVQTALDRSLLAELCVLPLTGGAEVTVTLEAAAVGHNFPSGASHDRRVWTELIGYREGEVVWSTGVVADDEPLVDDPYLWRIHDTIVDAEGEQVHMFWDAVDIEVGSLPVVTGDPTDPSTPHRVTTSFPIQGYEPDRVELRVRVRPMGFDILQDLIDSGDLDPALLDAMPTFSLQTTELVWEGDLGTCVD